MTLFLNILSWLAVIVSLLGNFRINCKHRDGFIIWIISNIIWIGVNIMMPVTNWGQVFLFVIYILTSVHGWLNWSKI